jgi:hypothetical protein
VKIWIEVTSGDWGWTGKVQDSPTKPKRGLKAPASTRYFNLLKNIESGDVLLTYLTQSLTSKKEWKGSIMGISKIKNNYYQVSNTIFIDTFDDLEFPTPISFSEFKNLDRFSDSFSTLVRKSMQNYISEISHGDFIHLMEIHKENLVFLKNDKYSFLLKHQL